MATTANASPSFDLPVLPGEDAWTPEEIEAVRADLRDDITRMRQTIAEAEEDLADRMNDGPDGAGKDPADVGASNFELDQEMSLNANTRHMLHQSELALKLLDEGGYGYCESCGQPIGKLRLQAFPRATMCVACKQRAERR